MKRFFMISAMVLTMALFACSGDDTETTVVEPNFPAAVTPTVASGESYTVEFTPNLDWMISIPADKMTWFWIQDGNQKVNTVRGKAGEKASVEILTSDIQNFDNAPVCEVTMTMGGKSQVIATVTIGTIERTFALYKAVVEEGGFVSAEDGNESDSLYFKYETATANGIELIWPEGQGAFTFRFLVEANFGWGIKSKPEWLELTPTEGEAGQQVEVRISGDNIVGGATGQLIFCDAANRDAEYSYNITLPDCSTMFSISGLGEESVFNGKGQYASVTAAGTPSWMPAATASVTDIAGTQVLVFEMEGSDSNPKWVAAGADSWINTTLVSDDSDGALNDYTLTITVDKNEGAERKGRVYAVPAAGAPEGGALPESKYLVTTVRQLEGQPETTVMPVNPKAYLDEGKVVFENLTENNNHELDHIIQGVTIPEGFLLGYGDQNSADYAALKIDREYTVKFYDFDYQELKPVEKPEDGDTEAAAQEEQAEPWLTGQVWDEDTVIGEDAAGNPLTEKNYFLRVLMNPGLDKTPATGMACDNLGFAVLFDTEGNAFALIRCEYTEPDNSGSGDEYLSWVNPSAVNGATLTRATKENAADLIAKFPALKTAGINECVESVESYIGVYVLEYTTANPTSAGINVAQFFMTQTYSGGDWLSVDDSQAPYIFVDMSARSAKGDLHWVDFYVGETMATIKSVKLFCIANF